MKDFLKALAVWWKDPVTEAVFAAIGVVGLLNSIDRGHRLAVDARACADDAHERIDALESALLPRPA